MVFLEQISNSESEKLIYPWCNGVAIKTKAACDSNNLI